MTPEESYSAFLDRVVGPLPEGEDGQLPAPESSTWEIASDDQADWALGKIAEAYDVIGANEAFFQRQLARLEAWVTQANAPATRQAEQFKAKLHGYLLHLQEAGKLGRKKSHTLPNGTLQLRHVRADFEVVKGQEAAFLAWCEDRNLVKVEVTYVWGEAKKSFVAGEDGLDVVYEADADGQVGGVIPGVRVTRHAGESFHVKPAKDERAGEG